MITYRLPSYGIFGTRIQTQYLYGVPCTISFGGLSMDVDHMANQTVSKSNDRQQWIAFNRAVCARASAMEHQVPEMMFSTGADPAHGISAVKALALAAEQGQRIWTITSENLDIALQSISLAAETKTDIRNAVRAGKVVTAHEARINFYGWIGEGYTVIDPNTGAGAYMIAGGKNGGVLITLDSNALHRMYLEGLGAEPYEFSPQSRDAICRFCCALESTAWVVIYGHLASVIHAYQIQKSVTSEPWVIVTESVKVVFNTRSFVERLSERSEECLLGCREN